MTACQFIKKLLWRIWNISPYELFLETSWIWSLWHSAAWIVLFWDKRKKLEKSPKCFCILDNYISDSSKYNIFSW